jgi:hypothetical protein
MSAPVGLPGEFTTKPRVRGVTASSIAWACTEKPSSTWVRVKTGVASASLICSGIVRQQGECVMTSSPGPNSEAPGQRLLPPPRR